MCFILHIATKRAIDQDAWSKAGHAHVGDICGTPELVRSHFTLPEVASVTPAIGCACWFRWASFQGDYWPEADAEEWGARPVRASDGPDHLQEYRLNHRSLFDLVTSLIEGDESVELYGCWIGTEQHQTEREDEIEPSRLLDDGFWIRERVLYRISGPISDMRSTPGNWPEPWKLPTP